MRALAKKKQKRAWTAYLELTETAHWIEVRLRTPLEVAGLTREEFRLLVMLYRDRLLKLSEAEEKLGRTRQNVFETVRRAEELGWVRRAITRLPSAPVRPSRLSKERRDKPRVGRRVATIELTREGERLIEHILPRQENVLRSILGELDSREMESLIRICRKVRRADMVAELRYAGALVREYGDADFASAAQDAASETPKQKQIPHPDSRQQSPGLGPG